MPDFYVFDVFFRNRPSRQDRLQSGHKCGRNSAIKMPDQHAVVEKHRTLSVYEESVLPFNTILLILLALVMLIGLIFVRRKR